MILTKKNDMYVYFEVIRRLEPDRILDIGMFLKRVGSVSRQILEDGFVPETIILDGIDFWPEMDFPIWKRVYNSILDKNILMENHLSEQYDLVIMLGAKEIGEQYDLSKLLDYIKGHARYVLLDEMNCEWKDKLLIEKVLPLQVDNDNYYFIDFGE